MFELISIFKWYTDYNFIIFIFYSFYFIFYLYLIMHAINLLWYLTFRGPAHITPSLLMNSTLYATSVRSLLIPKGQVVWKEAQQCLLSSSTPSSCAIPSCKWRWKHPNMWRNKMKTRKQMHIENLNLRPLLTCGLTLYETITSSPENLRP